jgi:predicted P-loop ATPase
VTFICLGAGVIKTSLIISCVELCLLSFANGKAENRSDLFSVRVVFGVEISKKVSKTRMQANRQMIVAKAINLRANKAPFKIDEIIDFSLNSF